MYMKSPNKKYNQEIISNKYKYIINKINLWINSYPKRILGFASVLITISIMGILKISNNSSIYDDFRPGNNIYDSIKFVDENLGGVFPIEIIIETDKEKGFLDPIFLQSLDEFQDSVKQIYTIGSLKSIVDIIKMMNKEFNKSYSIPMQKEEILSFISLDEHIFDNYVIKPYKKGRITCRTIAGTSKDANYTKALIREYAMKILPNNYTVSVSGSIMVMLKTNKYLVNNLLTSFIVASVVIFFSMMILFKSKRLALLSILPNMIPLMFAGGVMGLQNIILRPSTAMTFSIALGIAVDDTIHFLARFRKEYINYNGDYIKAINHTLLTTGKAIISTTIVISLGFLALLFSEYVPNYEFGILGTIILVVALAGSLILLPVLIIFLKPQFSFYKKNEY